VTPIEWIQKNKFRPVVLKVSLDFVMGPPTLDRITNTLMPTMISLYEADQKRLARRREL
jgi:hypothetical protein